MSRRLDPSGLAGAFTRDVPTALDFLVPLKPAKGAVAEPVGAEPVGAEPVGAEPVGAEPVFAEPAAESVDVESVAEEALVEVKPEAEAKVELQRDALAEHAIAEASRDPWQELPVWSPGSEVPTRSWRYRASRRVERFVGAFLRRIA